MSLSPPSPPASRPLRCGKLHGIETGRAEGPLVILLHGFPDFSWGWRKQVPALVEQGFRVVVPDQRGYAHSDKPLGLRAYQIDELVGDIVHLAEACGRKRFRLVGHDWGGLVAWWVAVRHPERVEQLVVINAPHPDVWSQLVRRRWSQARKSWYIAFFQIPWFPELVLRLGNFALLRHTLRRSSRRGTFTTGDLENYVTAWSQPGALTAMLNYYRALRYRPAASPARIKPPALLLWGEQDAFLERELAEASLALCDRAESRFYPNGSHWVQLEEPVPINSAISRFFKDAPLD